MSSIDLPLGPLCDPPLGIPLHGLPPHGLPPHGPPPLFGYNIRPPPHGLPPMRPPPPFGRDWPLAASPFTNEVFFGQLVRFTPALPNSIQPFHRFLDFPEEIRQQVYNKCDPPTLFMLLQTSSAVRAAVHQAFWSLKHIWFKVSDRLMLEASPTLADTYESPDPIAASYVHQLLVVVSVSLLKDIRQSENPVIFQQELVEHFWTIRAKVFPSVKKIVLDCTIFTVEGIFEIAYAIKRACPSTIDIAIIFGSLRDNGCTLHKFDDNGVLKLVEKPWTGQRVYLPRTLGYMGMSYKYILNRQILLWEQQRVKRFRQALPAPAQIGVQTGNDAAEERMADLRKHEDGLAMKTKSLTIEWYKLYDAWGTVGSQRRTSFEAAFNAQLDEDPLITSDGRDEALKLFEWIMEIGPWKEFDFMAMDLKRE